MSVSVLSYSQPTPVSEDTTALFGPPLETPFGEPKIEGKQFSVCLVYLEYLHIVCAFGVFFFVFFFSIVKTITLK